MMNGTQASVPNLQNFNFNNDPNAKLEFGMQLIRDAFNEKINAISDENGRLKLVLQTQKQQMAWMEDEMRANAIRISELEHQCEEQKKEMSRVGAEKQDVLEKYTLLKTQWLQLTNFKKSIVEMIARDTDGSEFGTSFNSKLIQQLANNVNFVNSTQPMTHTNDMHAPNRTRARSPSPARPRSASNQTPFGNGTAADLFSSMNTPVFNDSPSHPQEAVTVVPTHIANTATELYKQIREVLRPQEFAYFATNINNLNHGNQTVEVTLENIAKVLKDPELFTKLRNLIHQAEQIVS